MDDDYPLPRKRRITIRRVLLAMIVGIAIWWGVDAWSLATRPQFRVNYSDTGSLLVLENEDGGSYSESFRWGLTAERQLVILRPNVPEPGRLQVDRFDLESAQRVHSKAYAKADYDQAAKHLQHVGKELWISWPEKHLYPDSTLTLPSPFTDASAMIAIPQSRQSLRMAWRALGPPYDDVLMWVPGAPEWVFRHVLGVWDEDVGRFVWEYPRRPNGEEHSSFMLEPGQGEFLAVKRTTEKGHEIIVLKVPLASNSPWWGRCAGILTAIAILLLARRRRRVVEQGAADE